MKIARIDSANRCLPKIVSLKFVMKKNYSCIMPSIGTKNIRKKFGRKKVGQVEDGAEAHFV
jgi:hypothetical protein